MQFRGQLRCDSASEAREAIMVSEVALRKSLWPVVTPALQAL